MFQREAREQFVREPPPTDGSQESDEISVQKLIVKLPEATPEAFNMVLNYIYTDRIDPTEKGNL